MVPISGKGSLLANGINDGNRSFIFQPREVTTSIAMFVISIYFTVFVRRLFVIIGSNIENRTISFTSRQDTRATIKSAAITRQEINQKPSSEQHFLKSEKQNTWYWSYNSRQKWNRKIPANFF